MHTLHMLISVCLIILAYFDIYSLLPVLHKNSDLKQICNFTLERQFQSFFNAHLQEVMQKADWAHFTLR